MAKTLLIHQHPLADKTCNFFLNNGKIFTGKLKRETHLRKACIMGIGSDGHHYYEDGHNFDKIKEWEYVGENTNNSTC